jgi:hypothetical protein
MTQLAIHKYDEGRYVHLLTSETNRYHVRVDLWAAGRFNALNVSLDGEGTVLHDERRTLTGLWDDLPAVLRGWRNKARWPPFLPAHYDPYAIVTMTEVALLDAEYFAMVGMQASELNKQCSSHMERVKALCKADAALSLIYARIPEAN